jgi:hypothetical protein
MAQAVHRHPAAFRPEPQYASQERQATTDDDANGWAPYGEARAEAQPYASYDGYAYPVDYATDGGGMQTWAASSEAGAALSAGHGVAAAASGAHGDAGHCYYESEYAYSETAYYCEGGAPDRDYSRSNGHRDYGQRSFSPEPGAVDDDLASPVPPF